MTHVRKIKSGGVNTIWQNFVGEVGTLFYDHSLGNLRLSDGHTPGGVALNIDSAQAVATTSTIGSVQPDGTTISVDEYGVISVIDPGGTGDIAFVHGTIYHSSSTAITLQPSLFSDGWIFGTDGNLTFPGGSKIGQSAGVTGEIDIQAGSAEAAASLVSYDNLNYMWVDNSGAHIVTSDADYNSRNWVFNKDGTTTFPGLALSSKDDLSIVSPNVTMKSANITIQAGQGIPSATGNIESWTMDWNLNPRTNLPTTVNYGIGTGLRVTVLESGGNPYGVTIVTPGSGYENGQVVQVVSGSSLLAFRIIVPATKNWTFGTDGTTQFPYYTFPASTGTVGQVLVSNGSGTLAWTTAITTVSNLISGTYTVSLNATGDLLPTANNLGNLGSPTQQWNALYVNTATIYIGGSALRINADAGITLNNVGVGVNTISAGTDTAVVGSAGTFTINSISTLQSITGRGATTNNRISITNTTTSAGYQTGALTVSGGVGVAGALNVNGAATFGSTAVFQGSVTFAASSNTSYTANLFMLHTPPDGATATWTINDGKDIGILYPYYTGTTGTTGALVLSNGSKNLEWFGSGYNTSTQVGTYGTFKTNAIILAGGTQSIDTGTGDLVISGGVGIGKNLRAAYIYSNGWAVTTTTFNTSTLVAIAVTSTYAQSFNTSTLVALAVTSTYAQSFNTSTLVNTAVNAGKLTNGSNSISIDSSGHLLPSGNLTQDLGSTSSQWRSLYVSANTIYIGGTGVGVSTSGSLVVGGAVAVGSFTGTAVTGSINTSTGVVTLTFNTSTLVNTAVNATTSTYSNTASFARSFNTATLVAIAVTATGLGPNIITISNTSSATSNTSGALQVLGGVGIAGSVYASAVYSNGYAVSTSTSTANAITIQLNGTTLGVPTTINFATGTTASIIGNVVTVQATAVSGSATASTSTLNAGTYTVALSTSGVLTVPGTLQNLLNTGNVTISASSGTNTATWTFGTAGSLAFPDGSKQLTAFTGTVAFNTATLVALAVTATYAQSVIGGVVTTLTAGTGTYISTSTGGVTVWVTTASTFNTGTLVALAVTSTFAQSFNTATLVNTAINSTKLTNGSNSINIDSNGHLLPSGNLTQDLGSTSNQWRSLYVGANTIYIGGTGVGVSTSGSLVVGGSVAIKSFTGTSITGTVNTSTGVVTLAFNTATLVALAVTSTFAQSFNTATLVAIAVSATNASFATTSGYAQSFNTGTLVALAVTSTFAQSFNTATLVAQAVSAGSVVGGIGVATLTAGTGTYISTTTGAVTIWVSTASGGTTFNTGTLVALAVTATNANTSSYANTASSLGGSIILVTNITSATSTSTGALQVYGGVGIGGNLNIGGSFNASGIIYQGPWAVSTGSGGTSFTGGNVANITTFTNITSATSTSTGALQVYGGVGIGGNLNIGGSFNASGIIYQGPWAVSTATNVSGSPYTGIFTVTNTTNATSTNTGALQVAGGLGIGGNLYIGGSFATTGTNGSISGITNISAGNLTLTSSTQATSTSTGALVVAGGVGVGGNLYVASTSYVGGAVIITSATIANFAASFLGGTVPNAVNITSSTQATSTSTGSLVVAGGVGIGGDLYVGGNITANQLTIQYTTVTTTLIKTDDIISTYNTTQSTGTTTGALIVSGGVGIGGQVFIGGNHSIAGITTVTNTTAATSTSTGALQVYGGVGVGGNIYVGGIVTATTFVGSANPGTTSTTSSALGYLGMPQVSTASSYTLVASDQGRHIYITATGQTITIPANTAVSFPIGSTVAFIAGPSATTVSIGITTDTMYLGGSGTTGTRTLAAYGMATAVKVTTSTWFINGSGLT